MSGPVPIYIHYLFLLITFWSGILIGHEKSEGVKDFRTYCYRTWNSAQGYVAAWMRGEVGGRFSLFQSLSHVRLLSTPWTARQASLSITNSWSLLKLMSIELVMPSNYLILCRPFSSCLQSFPASGSLLMSWLFASGGQSIGASASASVLPMNIQG